MKRWRLLLVVVFSRVAHADEPLPLPMETAAPLVLGTAATATALPADAPRLYLDCDFCDANFVRENVGFVVFVRDRADADVQVIASIQPTTAGGYQGTLRFIGLGRFAEMEDQLTVSVGPDASPDDQRRELVRGLRIGLARYAARTRVGPELDVSWSPAEAPAPEKDPWDHWVMSLSGSGMFAGESSYRSTDTSLSGRAARVTDLWRIRASVYLFLTENRYDLGDDVIVESFRRDVGNSFFAGRSLGDHFTVGLRPSWSASTYTNIRSQYSTAGLFEYSVFPYSEATRRAVVLQYGSAVERPLYYEETIFEKEEEILFSEFVSLTFDTTQPWGSLNASVYGSHYFHDVSKADAYASVVLSARLVRGLSLTLSGTASVVRSQLYLPRAGATDEEILLRRRQLATQYTYLSSVGLSYTFGSIYTPVVNTRMAGY